MKSGKRPKSGLEKATKKKKTKHIKAHPSNMSSLMDMSNETDGEVICCVNS